MGGGGGVVERTLIRSFRSGNFIWVGVLNGEKVDGRLVQVDSY